MYFATWSDFQGSGVRIPKVVFARHLLPTASIDTAQIDDRRTSECVEIPTSEWRVFEDSRKCLKLA